MEKSKLTSETQIRVRFNEVDALRIVWHGHYINYFEDGRQDFGRKFQLGYLDVYSHGFTTPIVNYHCNHKLPLTFGEVATIKTKFVDSPAAKIIFDYEIFNDAKHLIATGQTTQVFLNAKNELELNLPDFYIEWKKRHGL